MNIAAHYSHLNGLEYLVVHQPGLWEEIQRVITDTDSEVCRANQSGGRQQTDKVLYSAIRMGSEFRRRFGRWGWKDMYISQANASAYRQSYLMKERIAVEPQFVKLSEVAFDLFVKHLAFFVGDVIDVGIEIVPMKGLQEEMSSGVPYYEGELYNLIREGRGVPAVPLVLIGVNP
jgi:hypothetical protein